ncbi:hypothetical protein CCB80_09125 [Armatimonadetes bacterium Uphvl-Ar1]|nr:hypothetical protein CCB80_09125 [Armatimonadetes bacterium Uphvl-Ar1]
MDTQAAAQSLGRVLADSYVLMLKTQAVHWHVVGGSFVGIHTLTEEQYNEFFLAVDEIAERIRALGHDAPGSMAEYLKLSRLKEGVGGPSDEEMVTELLNAHSTMSELLRKEIDVMDDLDDYGSEDLLIGRLRVHEKSAWMWKSVLTQITAMKGAVAPVASVKEDKPVKKEKKKEKKALKSEDSVKKEVPLPFKKPEAAVAEPVSGGGRRKLFGVKAEG